MSIEMLWLWGAAFAAGLINAVAGGGTLLLLPALLALGLPAVTANATATVALVPGYLLAAWGGRRALQARPRPPVAGPRIGRSLPVAIAGAATGAWLLSRSSEALFLQIVPGLVLLATLLFALGPPRTGGQRPRLLLPALFLACLYGGYFNGALGVVLLAVFGLAGVADLHRANAWKNLLSALVSVTAAVLLGAAGLLAWPQLLHAGTAAAAGGLAGATVAAAMPASGLRAVVVLVGLGASGWLFLR